MNPLHRVLCARILRTTVIITVGLVFCATIVQLSKYMRLINSASASVWQVMRLLVYISPDLISKILPISLAISIAVIFSRFRENKQLVALLSLGIPKKNLFKPICTVSIIVVCLLCFISLYYGPLSLQKFRLLETQIITNISLPQHSGNLITIKKISAFAEEYAGNFQFKNLIISDKKETSNSERIYKAENGEINDKILYLHNGEIIDYNTEKKTVIVTKFKHHKYDLSQVFSKHKIEYKTHELSSVKLLENMRDSKCAAEFHSRLLEPLLCLALVFLVFIIIMIAKYSRKTNILNFITAISTTIIWYGVHLGLTNAAQHDNTYIYIAYIFLFSTIFTTALFVKKMDMLR